MMTKRIWTALLAAVLLLCIVPVPASAANSVRVTLPDFPVSLNGQTLSNSYSKYPFLVYRGITYFPMTYSDCRLLGLRTSWNAADGLGIEKNDEPVSEYRREIQTAKNAGTQTARIADGKITVNGKTVDNSREQYPLLVFRDVTYFPLTWRFAVDEFGWAYHFDGASGLAISNPDAALTCKDVWTDNIHDYTALPGVAGDTPLACMFHVPVEGNAPRPYVGLYNMTEADVTVLPGDFQWEYQVYRVTGGGEELLYRKAVPFYSGGIPQWRFTHLTIDDTYDYSLSGKGDYRAVLVHPLYIGYQFDKMPGTTLSAPVEGQGYAIAFSREFTIE